MDALARIQFALGAQGPSPEEDRRRARLAAWIRRDGWSWDDMKPAGDRCP